MEVIHEQLNTKELEIQEHDSNCRRQWEILKEADQQDKDNIVTKKKAIQILAKEMEYIMDKRGIPETKSEICNIICRNMQTLGLSKAMQTLPGQPGYLDAKYKRSIDHSSSESLGKNSLSPGDLLDDCYIYARELREHLRALQNIDYHRLNRRDIQEVAEGQDKNKTKIYDDCEELGIPILDNDKDYKSPPDPYAKTINFPETKSARTIFTEAIERHIGAWQHVLEKVVTEAGDKKTGRLFQSDTALQQCADGLDQMTNLLKPITDRKYRKNWLQWFNIVKHANAWFKHSAARKFEVKDFEDFIRSLTREQIGFRMTKEGSMTFDQVVKFFVGYFRIYVIWYPQVREPLGAQFSRMLHGKLQNKS